MSEIIFYRIMDSVALRSDCADVQADLGLHGWCISEGSFSHNMSHIANVQDDLELDCSYIMMVIFHTMCLIW